MVISNHHKWSISPPSLDEEPLPTTTDDTTMEDVAEGVIPHTPSSRVANASGVVSSARGIGFGVCDVVMDLKALLQFVEVRVCFPCLFSLVRCLL